MKRINNLLACLDLTNMDRHLIAYAAFLAKALGIQSLKFLHVIQEYDLESEELEGFGSLEDKLESYIRGEILKNIPDKYKDVSFSILVKKENKDASDVLLQTIRRQNIDLTILGKKAETERKERYSARTIALGESEMLLVPANPPKLINRVHIALDFSRFSGKAFELGAEIADFTNARLSCQYIYDQPAGFFPIMPGRFNLQRGARIGRSKKNKFIRKNHYDFSDVECYTNPAEYSLQPDKIMKTAQTLQASLICIGAKGKTSVPSSLLGLITTKMRQAQGNIPVLIVKNKMEKSSFWNMLLHG